MAAYDIYFDEERAFLICRVACTMSAGEAEALCAELNRELALSSARGPLRLLWDHRAIPVIPDENAEKLQSIWRDHSQEGDRIAIMVSTSLDKVHGKPSTVTEAAFFLSENAACTWLNVGMARAA